MLRVSQRLRTSIATVFLFVCFRAAHTQSTWRFPGWGKIGAVAAGLHHRSRQPWILNPLSEARDQTRVLIDASRVSLTTEPWQELLNSNFLKIYFIFYFWLGLRHLEVPGPGIEASTTTRAAAVRLLSHCALMGTPHLACF